MKLKEINPKLKNLPTKEFLTTIQWSTIFNLLPQVAEYYNSRLSMIQVLNHYGMGLEGGDTDEIQVNCIFLEHGSEDRNKSARYYAYDRNTCEAKEGVYCFKCQKYYTTFWYLYKMEREYRNMDLINFFLWIKVQFGVDFPKDMVLDFDPDSFYTFDGPGDRQNILSLFSYAKTLREIKNNDPVLYLKSIVNLYQTMKIGG